jgi:hypothetical protein
LEEKQEEKIWADFNNYAGNINYKKGLSRKLSASAGEGYIKTMDKFQVGVYPWEFMEQAIRF